MSVISCSLDSVQADKCDDVTVTRHSRPPPLSLMMDVLPPPGERDGQRGGRLWGQLAPSPGRAAVPGPALRLHGSPGLAHPQSPQPRLQEESVHHVFPSVYKVFPLFKTKRWTKLFESKQNELKLRFFFLNSVQKKLCLHILIMWPP